MTDLKPAVSAKSLTPRGRLSRGIDAGAGLSVQDRMARGKLLRKAVPHAAQGEWLPRPDRQDPVDILERQSATRLPGADSGALRADE